ncbi:hypothetical protein CEG14_12555 [Bordetella genomosp. 1]|uniref:Periplasmic heavy metal sensor n=1 Tax=Bordetella genomosp. 1 TaxID=1395607 RepID=A0A261SHP6_9BORD|nr:hypothetical protein [Bordetella genomosp. 1]MDQ8032173.1 hypothetical protein [Bordetella sp.]OZI35873.1 hypothetical protein CEG14_12555 [Bordetella genomosp. 1]OZI58541.1 hypothetical protein CAL27_17765 [Bordetella genomosp. 1]
MSRNRFALRSSLAGLAMVISAGAFVAPAMAAPQDGKPAPEARHKGPRHGGEMRDGAFIPGIGPLSKADIDALKLDAKQQGLFDTARASQEALMKQRFEAGRAEHQLLKEQLAANKLDPRALSAAGEKSRDQFRAEGDKVRDQWLAVWDSLNPGQRDQVTKLVKERSAKMEERMAKKGHRGDAPPPPPPAPAPAQ